MGKLPHGVLGKHGTMTRSFIGVGASGARAREDNTKTWDGAKSATRVDYAAGPMQIIIPTKPNHGGMQQASSKGVKYKGVSTGYC